MNCFGFHIQNLLDCCFICYTSIEHRMKFQITLTYFVSHSELLVFNIKFHFKCIIIEKSKYICIFDHFPLHKLFNLYL